MEVKVKRENVVKNDTFMETDFTEVKIKKEPLDENVDPKGNKCCYCSRKFSSQKHLQSHMNLHTNLVAEKYQCDKCPFIFPSKKSLLYHLSSSFHSKHKPYFCGICHMRFFTGLGLFRHKATRMGACGLSKCSYCHRKFSSVEKLRFHMRNEGCQNLTCPTCRRSFISPWHIKAHLKSCNRRILKRHQCGQCKKYFSSEETLTRHRKFYCNKKQICSFCLKEFKNIDSLSFHKLHQHRSELWKDRLEKAELFYTETFNCQECGYEAPNKRYYEVHLAKHKEKSQEEWECNECDATFRFKTHLKSHMKKAHNGELSCMTCRKKFKSTTALNLHEKTHVILQDESPGLLSLLL